MADAASNAAQQESLWRAKTLTDIEMAHSGLWTNRELRQMSDIPPVVDGQYISVDGGSYDTYSEAYAANLRLAERKKRYGKISSPWNAVDLLDENDISFITYALSTLWLVALGVFGYNHQWRQFIITLTLFLPIVALEILIQKIPRTFRKVAFLVSAISALLLVLFFRFK